MTKYKVYIQAYHETIVEANSKEEARMEVIENLSDYFIDSEMIGSCTVGEAEEIKNER